MFLTCWPVLNRYLQSSDAEYSFLFLSRNTCLCHGFTSNQIFPVIWEGVRIMEMSGFCVRAFVSDGAAPNRRFYQLHRLQDDVNVSADGVVFWAWNRYAKHRKIYFICDPLHLIKTLRNNLENSNGHNKTRHLMVRNVFDLLASF